MTDLEFRFDDKVSLNVTTDDLDGFHIPAAQVAHALSVRDAHTLARAIPDSEKGYALVRTPGGEQSVTYLTEAGFFRAISQRQTGRIGDADVRVRVEAFQSWVFGTVLPEIRKTGSYAVVQSPELQMAHGLIAAQQMLEAKDQRIAELEAPAKSWQLLADASGDFSVAEAAKILSRDPAITTGRDRLFAYMAEEKWIFRSRNTRGGWEAYQTAVDTKRLNEKPATPFLNSKTGEYELPAPTIRVTAKGIGKLHELMGGTDPIRFIAGEAA